MRKVLVIAYYFPPIAATGGMRPLNFCRQLTSYGWLPRVLATDHCSALPPQAFDEGLLERIPSEIKVTRIPHANPRGRLLEWKTRLERWQKRTLPGGKESQSGEWGSQDSDTGRTRGWASSLVSGIAEALWEFPDLQYTWYRPAVQSQAQIDWTDRPELVWATGGPWTSLLVGRKLAQQWGVPFVADFRDPWIGNTVDATRFQQKAKALERSVCQAASRIVLNTEELCEDFRTRYPMYADRCKALTNGYAPELGALYDELVQGACHKARSDQKRERAFEICHFGTVYGTRSPIALFQAMEGLASNGFLTDSHLRVRFIGAWDVDDPACQGLAKSLEERGLLRREPPIPHRQCLEQMVQADCLLVLQQNFPLQIPAKIYEYIAARRPLLVIGGEGATANLVRRNQLGQCCPNRVVDIKNTLKKLVADGPQILSPDREGVQSFSYRVLTKRLADIFDATLSVRDVKQR